MSNIINSFRSVANPRFEVNEIQKFHLEKGEGGDLFRQDLDDDRYERYGPVWSSLAVFSLEKKIDVRAVKNVGLMAGEAARYMHGLVGAYGEVIVI